MSIFSRKNNAEEIPAKEERTWQQNLVMDLKDLFYVLAIFMLIYMLMFRVVVVVGSSMHDTLHNEDRLLLISNTFYMLHNQGYTKQQIYDELVYANTVACDPVLPKSELQTIVNSVTRYKR